MRNLSTRFNRAGAAIARRASALVARSRGAAFALVGTTAVGASMLAAPAAHASGGGSGLGATMLTKLAGIEGDVSSILVILVGVIALFILYGLIKKAR